MTRDGRATSSARVYVIHEGTGARIGCSCGSVLNVDTNDEQGFFELMDAWRERHPDGGYDGPGWHDEIAYADALAIRRAAESGNPL